MMAWLIIALLVGTMTWMFCALSVGLVKGIQSVNRKREEARTKRFVTVAELREWLADSCVNIGQLPRQ